MLKKSSLLIGLAVLLLGACTNTWKTDYTAALDPAVTRGWSVRAVDVVVPDELSVSDENIFAPEADIVWHGDPKGDRRAQVAAIVDSGITRGASALRGPKPVRFHVVLQQFHAVTPLAESRAFSAVHNISYLIEVRDMAGNRLVAPQLINADISAHVGSAALEAIQRGETQKVRITNHLARVTAGWLGVGPDPRQSFVVVGR